ncbi:MAG: ABC transporter permease [Alphaproteobacteria bacterium]|nr:ABC transporter permease [Alphaproteobacteria bacterium]
MRGGRAAGWIAPVVVAIVFLSGWEAVVRVNEIPPYILPSPIRVVATLWTDGPSLLAALWVTLRTTFIALTAATLLGLAIAVALAQSPLIERSFYPYLVMLQVTPIVSIAPLIIIWSDDLFLSLLICAWIVAFFPIVANTTLGLNSADRGLGELFRLYGASRWQMLVHLRLPTALPYFLEGVRISGGLALIGAVVAEFVAGSGGNESGLAFRILEAGYRLQIPRMFAALFLLTLAGVVIHAALGLLARRLLRRWHESAATADR